jgi:hypothetical protein
MAPDLAQDVIKVHPLTSVKGVFTIAVGTAQRASGQPDKHGGESRLQSLALQGMENLGDFQHALAGFSSRAFFSGVRHKSIVILTGLLGENDYALSSLLPTFS